MKLNKKLLIFLLSLVVLVSTLAVAAFAADGAKAAADDGLAFTYQVGNGEVQSVASLGTPEADGENFYNLLNDKANVKIKMYSDIVLKKGMLFGTLKEGIDDDKDTVYVLDQTGNVDWDLNGCTVTVPADVTPVTVVVKDTGSHNFNTLHWIGTYTFKLYSSIPGGQYINQSAYSIFGVSKYGSGAVGAGAQSYLVGTNDPAVCGGDNLTVTTKGGLIEGYESNAASATPLKAYLTVNGGTYVYEGSKALVMVGDTNVVKNATFITTGAATAIFSNMYWKAANLTLENITACAANDATQLAIAGNKGAPKTSVNAAHKVALNGAVLLGKGLKPVYNVTSDKVTYTLAGILLANDDAVLSAAYPTPPTGVAKGSFDLEVRQADGTTKTETVFGYVADDQLYTVTYGTTGITKRYLVGFVFAPIAMKTEYYTVTVDAVAGTANIPVAWENLPANGILDASYGGQTVTVTPADNYLPLAFALYDDTTGACMYTLADSDTIGAELVTTLAAQENAATLYVYQDITAPALTFAKDVTVELADATLTMGGAITVSEGVALIVNGGEMLSAQANPFAVNGKLTMSGTKVYLSSATVVFVGNAGTVAAENVGIYNLASASMAADGVTATISDAKLMGVALGANVTASGTVLGTAGTFNGNAFGDGMVTGLFINNNTESITVLGQSYEISYVEAATDDADKVITVTYTYADATRGEHTYYYGSIPSFYKVLAEGYYFEYVGEAALTESITVECAFRADASKLKAQATLTDALNYIFYLQVEDAGVLQNLMLNGKALDFASLAKTEMEGKSYYVIPVAFDTFADALDTYELSVDLVSEDESLTVKASAALHEYLGALLDASEEEVAKTAYAVAGYVSALVSYFDYDFAFGDVRMKNLGRLNNLLADYEQYKVEAELPAETEISSAYVSSVLLVADEKVTFAFRVANDFAGSVEIGGVEVDLSKPFEGFDRTYATTVVSLADLGEEITLTVKDAEGTVLETFGYSLEDYVSGVINQNEGTAGAYAKALWNLASVLG